MLRSILTTCLPHNIHIVYLWTTHGLQGRINIEQHRPCVNYINRVAIQWKLLVKFSYNLHINSLLKALLICVIIGLHIQQLLQHPASTHLLMRIPSLIPQYILPTYFYLNSSSCILSRVSFQNFQTFIFILFLDFLTHIF